MRSVEDSIIKTQFETKFIVKERQNRTAIIFTSGTSPIQDTTLSLDALGQCVYSLYPTNYQNRYQEFGNEVLWLNEVVPYFLPNLWDEIYNRAIQMNKVGMKNLGWKSIEEFNIRTIEFIDYERGNISRDQYGIGIDLEVDVHDDNGSAFTMVYCVGDNYTGGEFLSLDDETNEIVGTVKLKKGESLMIQSETLHAVAKVEGYRRVLCIEFWNLPPSKLRDGRQSWVAKDASGQTYFANGNASWYKDQDIVVDNKPWYMNQEL